MTPMVKAITGGQADFPIRRAAVPIDTEYDDNLCLLQRIDEDIPTSS